MPWLVERAVGDMKLDSQVGAQLVSRYNVLLEQDWLKSELGLELAPGKIEQICKMDVPSKLSDFAELERLALAKRAKPEHPPGASTCPGRKETTDWSESPCLTLDRSRPAWSRCSAAT